MYHAELEFNDKFYVIQSIATLPKLPKTQLFKC